MKYICIFLVFALLSCDKGAIDPNLAKLEDSQLRKILIGKWEKVTEEGYEQIIFGKIEVEYIMSLQLGNQSYKRDSYDFEKTKYYISVRFLKKGLVMQEEKITSISNDTWTNAIDGHRYKKK